MPVPRYSHRQESCCVVGMAFGLGPEDTSWLAPGSHGGFGKADLRDTQLSRAKAADHALLPRRGNFSVSGKNSAGPVTRRAPFCTECMPRFSARDRSNRGLGGSMHAFFEPFGIYPNNAIVGVSSLAPVRRFQEASTQAGINHCQHRRTRLRLRPGWGRYHFLGDDRNSALGRNRWAEACHDHFQLHEKFLRHGGQRSAKNHGCRLYCG